MKAYSKKKNLICMINISQNFSTEKNSFEPEFIDLIKTGLDSATAPALISPSFKVAKRDIITLNKLVINYLPRCTFHLL